MTTEPTQPEVREETVTVWNGRLDIRVKTAGSGPPLLYLHGATGLVWDPFLAHLAGQYSVYAPEFPGTSAGDPDAVHVVDDLSDMVLAHEEVIRRLGLERPVIVGHDFGGMLAAELAAHFPDLPGKLVLLAPLGLWREDMPVASLMTASQDKLPGLLFHDSTGEVAQAALAFPEDPEAAVAAAAGMVWSLGSTGKFVWPIPDRGLRARLHRVVADTLVVWGREDSLVPVGYADEFADHLARSTVAVVEGSGHLPQIEQFKQTVAKVEEFL